VSAVSSRAVLFHKRSLRPSYLREQPLREQPLIGHPQPFSPTSMAVIDALNGGASLGEAARVAGTAKSTARIVRLRARRRGLLNAKAVRAIAAAKLKSKRDNARGEARAAARRAGL
jgi:hypothetical protein